MNKIPHSAEAESGTLGSMMLDPRAITEAAQEITKEHFYVPANQFLYSAMLELWSEGKTFDLLTLTQYLRDKGILENIGGAKFITATYTFVPSASNLRYYLDILKDKFIARRIIATCGEAVQKAYNEQDAIPSLLAQVQSDVLKIGEGNDREMLDIKEHVATAIDEIEKSHQSHGSIPGLSTGLIDLDKKMGGMRSGQLIVVAGETGEGKSALGLSILRHAAVFNKIPSAIISLEMSGGEITQRLISDIGKINLHDFIITGGRTADFTKIASAGAKIRESPIYIRDDSDVDALKMRAIARQLKQEKKIQLLILDYVQLLTPAGVKEENRERAMATAAQALKQMAKELDIVVIGLSQLNEQGRLRESRAIGHHSDVVMTIEHDELESFIHINKNRSGPVGKVPARFLREFTSWENASLSFQNLPK